MREQPIQSAVVKYARSQGVIAVKMTVGAGFPDFMFLYEGKVAFVEFKATRGQATHLQKYQLGRLEKHGFDCALVRDIEHGKTIIDLLTGRVRDVTL